jgi:hypothetical protein
MKTAPKKLISIGCANATGENRVFIGENQLFLLSLLFFERENN